MDKYLIKEAPAARRERIIRNRIAVRHAEEQRIKQSRKPIKYNPEDKFKVAKYGAIHGERYAIIRYKDLLLKQSTVNGWIKQYKKICKTLRKPPKNAVQAGFVEAKRGAKKLIPGYLRSKIIKLWQILHNIKYSIPDELIVNADETGTPIINSSNYTMAEKGSVNVIGDAAHGDKRQITTMLAGSKAGKGLIPQCIYGGTTPRCEPNYTGTDVLLCHSKSHWQTTVTLRQWIMQVYLPFIRQERALLRLPASQKAILTWDIHTTHIDSGIKAILKRNNIILWYVPAGMTDILQVMDLSINGKFKNGLKVKYNTWYASEISKQLKNGVKEPVIDTSLGNVKLMHLNWVLDVWQDICTETPNSIVKGWHYMFRS